MTLLDIESNWYFEFEDNCHASRGSSMGDLSINFHMPDQTTDSPNFESHFEKHELVSRKAVT